MTHTHRITPHLIAALGFLCVLLASASASAECNLDQGHWDYLICMATEQEQADADIAILEAEANTLASLASACTGQNITVQTDTAQTIQYSPSCLLATTIHNYTACQDSKLDEANAIINSLQDEVNDLATQLDACIEDLIAEGTIEPETTTTECTVSDDFTSDDPFSGLSDIEDIIRQLHAAEAEHQRLEGCLEAEARENGGVRQTQCVLEESDDPMSSGTTSVIEALQTFGRCLDQEAREQRAEYMQTIIELLEDAASDQDAQQGTTGDGTALPGLGIDPAVP